MKAEGNQCAVPAPAERWRAGGLRSHEPAAALAAALAAAVASRSQRMDREWIGKGSGKDRERIGNGIRFEMR